MQLPEILSVCVIGIFTTHTTLQSPEILRVCVVRMLLTRGHIAEHYNALRDVCGETAHVAGAVRRQTSEHVGRDQCVQKTAPLLRSLLHEFHLYEDIQRYIKIIKMYKDMKWH
jgi:hypothetical protein